MDNHGIYLNQGLYETSMDIYHSVCYVHIGRADWKSHVFCCVFCLFEFSARANVVQGSIPAVLSLRSRSGVDIMEADDRQVTTVFTVQLSFQHQHSTNRVS